MARTERISIDPVREPSHAARRTAARVPDLRRDVFCHWSFGTGTTGILSVPIPRKPGELVAPHAAPASSGGLRLGWKFAVKRSIAYLSQFLLPLLPSRRPHTRSVDTSSGRTPPSATRTWWCRFKEAGLGRNQSISDVTTADSAMTYVCVNNGVAYPSAQNRTTISGPVSASGMLSSGKNGQGHHIADSQPAGCGWLLLTARPKPRDRPRQPHQHEHHRPTRTASPRQSRTHHHRRHTRA